MPTPPRPRALAALCILAAAALVVALPLVMLVLRSFRTPDGGLGRWFGAAPDLTLTLTLRNGSGTSAPLAPVVLSRGSVSGSPSHTMFGTPHGGANVPNVHFRALVPVGHEYHYQHAGYTPNRFTLELASVGPGHSMLVSVPYAGQAPSIYRDWWIDERNRLPAYGSLSSLRGGANTGYYLDPNGRLYLKLVVQEDRDYAHLTICASALCR